MTGTWFANKSVIYQHCQHSQFVTMAYNTSKRGVCHMMEQMALDYRKDGLLAYAVSDVHLSAILKLTTIGPSWCSGSNRWVEGRWHV
jgi:NAD(P)-dependent dehydrogenase (short-subunit alcohol dehydrogenase family)